MSPVEFIRWEWGGKPVQTIPSFSGRLEFGLRNDGVVVWREITNTTNSPAESASLQDTILWKWWTNGVTMTNVIIPNKGITNNNPIILE